MILISLIFAGAYFIRIINTHPQTDTAVDHFYALYEQSVNTLNPQFDAATFYHQAAEMLLETDFLAHCPRADRAPNEPWSAGEHPELARFIEDNPEILEMFIQGSRLENCLRPIGEPERSGRIPPGEKFVPEPVPYLIACTGLSLGEGNTEEALARTRMIVRITNHLRQAHSLLRSVMAVTLENKLHELLQNAILVQPAAAEYCSRLKDIISELEEYRSGTIERDFLWQMGLVYVGIEQYYDGVFVVDTSNYWTQMRDVLKWRWRTWMNNRAEAMEQYYYWYDLLLERRDLPYFSDRYQILDSLFVQYSDLRMPGDYRIWLLSRHPNSILEADITCQEQRQATALLIALTAYHQDHNTYPGTLKKLIPQYLDALPSDPWSGSEWQFRIHNGQIVLAVNKDGVEKIVVGK